MRYIFLITFFCFCYFNLEGLTFKDRLAKAQSGDYVVTQQNKLISLLIIKNISENILVLEEISLPQDKVDSKISWSKWVKRF